MKIQLRFGLCHTIVLDKDSKFFGVFNEAVDLLQINRRVLSGGNHNCMLIKRVNRYLNKGLKIITNERNSVRIAMKAILLLLYAWNSTPIPGTDISRCFVALGHEFQFLIDFSADKHLELTATPASVTSYSRDLATCLSALREVATLLVDEQRAYHCEFINARHPDPKLYSVGDTVFAPRATRSDSGRGQVDILIYPFTGPWLVTAKLDGASYEIEHVTANTHLLRPTDSSETYADRHKLLPLRKYINPTHMDTFIHGLFEFATINKQKSRDRVSQLEWYILKSHCNLYHNPLPRFYVPTYSVHVDAGAHTLSSSAQREHHTPNS